MSEEDNEEYICLINEEEQYSIWFVWKEIPIGWKKVGPKGTKQEVLNYVKEVWTDMRPRVLENKWIKLY